MDVSARRDIQSQSIMSNVTQVNSQPMSYANVAQTEVCPGRDQAIVIDSVDGVPIKEYAIAVAKIIGPQNIISVSRISQKRVCLYLASKDK